MNNAFVIPGIAAAFLACAGCQEKPADQKPEAVTPAEWASLQTQIGILVSQVQGLQAKVETLQQSPAPARAPETEPAVLSATDTGFSLARTRFGPIAVSVESAEQYLDGYKLRLHLGNFTSARLLGVHLKIAWGIGGKNKDFEILKPLLPGTFTSAEVLLSPADAGDIKLIAVTVIPDKIYMNVN